MMRCAIGIDIGGTQMKAIVVDADGKVLSRGCFDTGDSTGAWASIARDYVAGVERKHGPTVAVGVASPGLAASDGRSIAWMRGRMEAVQGFDWTAHLRREHLVPVLNDAHAALLGELWCGAAVACKNAVMLTLGTGVGGAIVCDGRLLRGHLGRAGHLGHLSLDPDGKPDIVNTPGSLEDAIGEHTLLARSEGKFASTAALVEAFRAGDADARRVWLKSIRALAAAIVSTINIVDPQVVIVGGGIANAGAALFEPLARELEMFEWRPLGEGVKIVPAALGEFAGAIGAARNAMTEEL
jgi:glucokinase